MDALVRCALMAAARFGPVASIADHARRLVVASLGAAAACILGIAAIGCAAASLWIFAIPRLGPAGAPLVVAFALLAIGLAVVMLTGRRLKRRRTPPPSSAEASLMLADAMRLLKDHKAAVLMTALLAGFAAGSDKG
jgi:hypothetical protein